MLFVVIHLLLAIFSLSIGRTPQFCKTTDGIESVVFKDLCYVYRGKNFKIITIKSEFMKWYTSLPKLTNADDLFEYVQLSTYLRVSPNISPSTNLFMSDTNIETHKKRFSNELNFELVGLTTATAKEAVNQRDTQLLFEDVISVDIEKSIVTKIFPLDKTQSFKVLSAESNFEMLPSRTDVERCGKQGALIPHINAKISVNVKPKCTNNEQVFEITPLNLPSIISFLENVTSPKNITSSITTAISREMWLASSWISASDLLYRLDFIRLEQLRTANAPLQYTIDSVHKSISLSIEEKKGRALCVENDQSRKCGFINWTPKYNSSSVNFIKQLQGCKVTISKVDAFPKRHYHKVKTDYRSFHITTRTSYGINSTNHEILWNCRR